MNVFWPGTRNIIIVLTLGPIRKSVMQIITTIQKVFYWLKHLSKKNQEDFKSNQTLDPMSIFFRPFLVIFDHAQFNVSQAIFDKRFDW